MMTETHVSLQIRTLLVYKLQRTQGLQFRCVADQWFHCVFSKPVWRITVCHSVFSGLSTGGFEKFQWDWLHKCRTVSFRELEKWSDQSVQNPTSPKRFQILWDDPTSTLLKPTGELTRLLLTIFSLDFNYIQSGSINLYMHSLSLRTHQQTLLCPLFFLSYIDPYGTCRAPRLSCPSPPPVRGALVQKASLVGVSSDLV